MDKIWKMLLKQCPARYRDQLMMFYFGRFKIPLVGWVGPHIIEMSDKKTIIKVPLNYRSKNHLNSMYFGAMTTAADVAAALLAMSLIEKSGKNISFVFKDFHADFLKRAEGSTYFENDQGEEIAGFIDQVIASGERMNLPVKVVATVPSLFGQEPVAVFTLTMSMKLKS